ncbi:MAG: hypothetical protein D6737_05465 [Chloroflexi bacterium]|nr:MAG: hypothetical protein D6737_05465 [Chloroflexota bacterium]
MREITFARRPVNADLLTEQLQSTFGPRVTGISLRPRQIVVHVDDAFNADDEASVQGIIETHDATQLTAEQRLRANREAARIQAREAANAALDLSAFDSLDPVLQLLARKVAWLEQEITSQQTNT